MLFPTLEFAIFFAIILPLAWLLRRWENVWKIFLLTVSYIFYGSWDPTFLILIIFLSSVIYFGSVMISKSFIAWHRKLYLTLIICITLGLLGFYKYYNFFTESMNILLTGIGLGNVFPWFDIALPIGISFITFQGIGYAVDVYRGEIDVNPSLMGMIDFFTFKAFFPQLVAGPIVRAKTFLPQFKSNYTSGIPNIQLAFSLILGGLFKKVVLSSYLQTHIVDKVLNTPFNYSPAEILLAIYGFSVQIYCDFSGYTDIAIGIALLLGFQLPENFNSPYRAVNIQDFWRRWHISLSTWLRDYLYIPLGGNRKGNIRTYINLIITMLLGGLWHGASMTFVIWGGAHGIALAVHKLWQEMRIKYRLNLFQENNYLPKIIKGISIFITFHFVSFLWVFFYHKELGNALNVFQAMFSPMKPLVELEIYIVLSIFIGLIIHFIGDYLTRIHISVQKLNPLAIPLFVNTMLLLIIIKMGPSIVPPFIYFQF